MADLTPVTAEAGAAEGDPQPVYTWAGPPDSRLSLVRSYTPSDGGAPRLVAGLGGVQASLRVWDTHNGALLGALPYPKGVTHIYSLVTYQRPSDGRPGIAAGFGGGDLCSWEGDGLKLLHIILTNADGRPVRCLAVYEEPTSGSTRLVSA
jgi:hypothetical protein